MAVTVAHRHEPRGASVAERLPDQEAPVADVGAAPGEVGLDVHGADELPRLRDTQHQAIVGQVVRPEGGLVHLH